MSGIVIVDVDNEYCDELMYSYQIIKEQDETYTVYVSYDILRGKYLRKKVESLKEAWNILDEEMKNEEFCYA